MKQLEYPWQLIIAFVTLAIFGLTVKITGEPNSGLIFSLFFLFVAMIVSITTTATLKPDTKPNNTIASSFRALSSIFTALAATFIASLVYLQKEVATAKTISEAENPALMIFIVVILLIVSTIFIAVTATSSREYNENKEFHARNIVFGMIEFFAIAGVIIYQRI